LTRDRRRIVERLSVDLDPGMRLQRSFDEPDANPQIALDSSLPKHRVEDQRSRQATARYWKTG
jgi:hypothetical protein